MAMKNENNYHPDHYADLKKSGLSDTTILEAGIKSVRPNDINKKLGHHIPAISSMYKIPYPGTDFCRYKVFYDDDYTGKNRKQVIYP